LILDTTYLLPLARIAIDTDLLRADAEKKAELKLEEVAVSLISIFELQAKAARLNIPAASAVKAVETILTAFKVEPFHTAEIIETSYDLRKIISDYIDCVIVATAIVLKEDLVTEDSLILSRAEAIRKDHKVRVLSFKGIIR